MIGRHWCVPWRRAAARAVPASTTSPMHRGTKLAGNLSRLPPEIVGSASGGVFRYAPDVHSNTEHLAVAIPVALGGGEELIVGRDVDEQRRFASEMGTVYFLALGVLTLGGLVAGFAVSRVALKRIETINVAARSIMAGDMSRRIAVAGSGDEFDGLAANLNAMLERIDALMSGLREVSDNIAHDLKTPLSRLRNSAEAALRESGADAYREGLEHTIEKADELIKTFNSLLLVARLEAGALEENAERFDVGEAVRDVAELYEPVAEERGMGLAVNVSAGPQLIGNRQLVVQAVANLIENAIKYSGKPGNAGSGAAISIDQHDGADAIEIAVADNGPGIAPEDRERVLKRFVRLEKSRTEPGTGLGLSLVQAVARLHGGSVRLEDNRPGLARGSGASEARRGSLRDRPSEEAHEAPRMAGRDNVSLRPFVERVSEAPRSARTMRAPSPPWRRSSSAQRRMPS